MLQKKRNQLYQGKFIKKSKKIHENKYDYSLVEYKNNVTKVKIICPIHGVFLQKPTYHVNNKNGCRFCSIEKRSINTDEFKKRAIKVHRNKYDYSITKYKNCKTKLKIICSKHGFFEQKPSDHLNGQGCYQCGRIESSQKQIFSIETFLERSQKHHNNKYDYSKVKYIGIWKKVIIICPLHGEFKQIPEVHMNRGYGCPKCGYERTSSLLKQKKEYFIKQSQKTHGNTYDYSFVEYKGNKTKVKIICPKHGEFWQRPSNHYLYECYKCSQEKNKASNTNIEIFIKKFLERYNIPYKQTDWEILDRQELDFYLPDYKLAIECNGIYWHSELAGKKYNYHLNKTKECESKGIKLIHILETEINQTPNLVVSRLKSILGIGKYRIYARNCKVKEISRRQKSEFLNKYHSQKSCGSKINLGLFYKNRLVSVMIFGKRRVSLGIKKTNEGEYELLRYAGNFQFSVIGGASKLFKHFERNYLPKNIISYADRRWSQGELYKKLGFKFVKATQPNYWYFAKDNPFLIKLFHRYNFRKNILIDKLEKFSYNKTEWENMQENGWNRIWDCGSLKFEKKYD